MPYRVEAHVKVARAAPLTQHDVQSQTDPIPGLPPLSELLGIGGGTAQGGQTGQGGGQAAAPLSPTKSAEVGGKPKMKGGGLFGCCGGSSAADVVEASI